ncbi:MAG TPA: glycosyltransferase family 4 protein [Tepidisphaeraceae bacterium]
MRIMLHDYGGHAFIAQLSRELARRGHELLHVYSASVQTPQGTLTLQPHDPDTLRFAPIKLPASISKHSLLKRRQQERQHGRRAIALLNEFQPDVLICATTPSEIQYDLVKHCRRNGIKTVTWVQDLHGLAAYEILRRKIPFLGAAIGRYYMWLDRQAMRLSDAVVIITEDFREYLRRWGVDQDKVVCIPNWGPLDDIPQHPKDNPWSRRHGLHDKLCLLYSGTLAMKHNPKLLLALAEHFKSRDDVRVVVVSEGKSANWLRTTADAQGLSNLITLPFQPFETVPQVLASGDILVSILEPEAGRFSVPSKVLAYLCTGRPLLLAMPATNLAARTATRAGAGVIVSSEGDDRLGPAVDEHLGDADTRRRMGYNGRKYALQHFNVGSVADRFERMIAAPMPEAMPLPEFADTAHVAMGGATEAKVGMVIS